MFEEESYLQILRLSREITHVIENNGTLPVAQDVFVVGD